MCERKKENVCVLSDHVEGMCVSLVTLFLLSSQNSKSE